MPETKEKKQILVGALVMIVILSVISLWRRPNLKVTDNTLNYDSGQDYLNSQEYLNYLKTIKVDKQASKQLFETILTQEDIKKEVETSLKTDQALSLPQIETNKIKTSNQNNSGAINQYLSESVSQVYSFNNKTLSLAPGLFEGSATVPDQLKPMVEQVTGDLYALSVPKDALSMHKALLEAYLSYADLIELAKSYKQGDYNQNSNLWPQLYKNYLVANASAGTYSQELQKLAGKYKITSIQVTDYYANKENVEKQNYAFIPKAYAVFGIGDTTFNFTLGDIPRIVMDSVKESLRSAFLQYAGSMLTKLVTKVEQNYKISNFLYYTDALVNAQYADDYLNKYVSETLDRQIIKKLIPQFNCGQQNESLKIVFKAKAQEYLGFDPNTISINDPNYYQKLAKVGDFMASPNGWETYYNDLAKMAQSQAEKASEKELTSSGLKTPRDIMQNNISSSINSIVSAERASFAAILDLGINNAESLISGTVAQLTQTLMNQFVFQGASNNGGNLAVLKEQSTCLASAVLTPVVALPVTQYQNSNKTTTTGSAMAFSCSGLSSLGSDCTTAVLEELSICANRPAEHTGQQSCSELKSSIYVEALLTECQKQIRPTSTCSALQAYLSKVP